MNKTQRSQIFPVDIEAFSHDGRGITNIDGKTTFVAGAIAQEKVTCRLTKKHSRYNEAEVAEVITAAPDRVTPLCPHFGVCGGCSMQHIAVDAQIQLKQNVLLEQLQHFGKVTPQTILSPISGNPWGYRRKARLGVRYVRKKERVLVGFREKFSNFLTDVQTCPVLDDKVGKHIAALGDLIKSLSQYEHIPQIEVAISDTETALVFRHLTPLPEDDLNKLCDFAKQYHMHFYLQPGSPNSIHKIWPPHSSEKLTYRLADYALEMQFYPLDFIQVNGEVNQLLLKQALQLLDPQPTDTILDLFCGLGNFTLPLAQKSHQVIGVEGSQEMVIRARENAAHNNIHNTEFYASNLMEPDAGDSWIQKKYDKILLDPPRTGAKEILPFFKKFAAKRICYVSCNPATLARDAGELVYNYGYKLTHTGVVNMFPHTSHIEAIALFEK
jgi:23S rRNA (uracil1939-C5)-methyltransferase